MSAMMESVANKLDETENTVEKVVEPTTEGEVAAAPAPETKQVNLVDINVTNENTALNLLVGFVNLAQKRGAFNMQESSKIWEAIQLFMKKP